MADQWWSVLQVVFTMILCGTNFLFDFADKLFDPIKYQTEVEKRQEQMRVFEEGEDNEEVPVDVDSPPSSIKLPFIDPYPRPSVTSLFSIQSSVKNRDYILPVQPNSPSSIAPKQPLNLAASTENLHQVLNGRAESNNEPVNFEDLKKDKHYVKLVKRHQKDLDALIRKHEKERSTTLKIHQTQVEKTNATYDKMRSTEEKHSEKVLKKHGRDSLEFQTTETKIALLERHYKEKMSEMSDQHEQEINELFTKQSHAEVGYRLYQIAEQLEYLKKLLLQAQEAEKKCTEELRARQMNELLKKQTRQSMEAARELSLDRNKRKEERERLQRERDRVNFERFKEERQILQRRHDADKEQLLDKHKDEVKRMEDEYKAIMDTEKDKYREATLKKKRASATQST